MEFSHLDNQGAPRMVDVGGKAETMRTAIARATVLLNERTLALLKAKALPKGDVLTTTFIGKNQPMRHVTGALIQIKVSAKSHKT